MAIKIGKTGTVRLTGKDLEELRRACFVRDDYKCQHIFNDRPYPRKCLHFVTWERGSLQSGHMAHIKSRGASGSDTLDNVVTKCSRCHIELEHNCEGKPCPPKN